MMRPQTVGGGLMDEQRQGGGSDLVTVGRIATVHGIRGELSVVPETDDPHRLEAGSEVLLETPRGEVVPRRILGSRPHQDRVLIQLEGVPDRTAAEALRGGRLCIREADLAPLPDGHVWRHELPGMAVVTEEGDALGAASGLLDTGGANQVLVVRGPRGELLLPFVELVVRAIDRDARRITVRLIDGMLS
jgi:16S rRNA processing protein RimM